MMGILTDCPQRPERLGWTGDLQIFSQAAIYNMDMETFFEKFLRDLRDDQLPNGRFPDVTPNPMRVATSLTNFFQQDALYGSPAWADAGIIVPWRLYVNYRDKKILEEHYAAAKAWLGYVWSKNPDFLWKNDRGLDAGDWLNGDTILGGDNWPRHEGTVPLEIISTQFFAHSADLMSRMAEALGRKDDAQKYRDLFDSIREAFLRAYVSKDGTIEGNTQAGYALALHFNLLPGALRPKAVSLLMAAIQHYNGGHLSTGMVATNRLMLELTRSGNAEEAYRLLLTHGFPSWGSVMDNGATTIWERWDGYIASRGFQFQSMNSFNHVAFGAVAEWMWQTIVGLIPDEQHPGYKHFTVRPIPGGGLTSAHGNYNSIYGPIDIQWEIKDRQFFLNVTVPPNASADIYLPTASATQATESGVSVSRAQGISGVRTLSDSVLVQIGSGEYHFRAPMNQQ
jgi:alpha-L-rhamnosidase